jgi:hypothetical protein
MLGIPFAKISVHVLRTYGSLENTHLGFYQKLFKHFVNLKQAILQAHRRLSYSHDFITLGGEYHLKISL